MKKLLFFINSLGGGGAEKVLIDLLNSLDSKKYDIHLVSVTGGIHENRLSENIHYRKIINVKNGFLGSFLSRFFYHLPLKLAYRFIKKCEYDVEIAYLEGYPTRVIASGKTNARKVAFVHCDVSVHGVLNSVYKNNDECVKEYTRFDKLCFVSQVAKEGFERTIGEIPNSIVLHNYIDFDSVEEKSLEKNDSEYSTSGMKFVAVGRLSKEKGYSRLIEIVGDLENQFDFELWLIGDGPEREKIESIIKTNEISSVKMFGFKENPYSYMKKADMIICPSFYEGYSTVVAEALSMGIPVLTTDCAGMNELLQNGKYGIIVENSEKGLRDGLEALLLDKQLLIDLKKSLDNRESINGLEEYETLFSTLFDT